MKSRALTCSIAALLIALLAPIAVAQQEQAATSPEAAAQEAWMKAGTPGPPHKVLEQFAGDWSFVMKAWMAPGAEPVASAGTSSNVMLYDGRYLKQVVDGEMMGQPFRGTGLTGYDNMKGKYVSAWIDNMGTSVMPGEGTWDAGEHALTMVNEFVDAVTGKTKQMRMVTRVEGPDRHVSRFFDTLPDGKEMMIMEILYTRK